MKTLNILHSISSVRMHSFSLSYMKLNMFKLWIVRQRAVWRHHIIPVEIVILGKMINQENGCLDHQDFLGTAVVWAEYISMQTCPQCKNLILSTYNSPYSDFSLTCLYFLNSTMHKVQLRCSLTDHQSSENTVGLTDTLFLELCC